MYIKVNRVPEHTGKFVAYYRVSTEKQGASGLGLEAQQHSVMHYLNGGDWELIAEFTEIESGSRNNRPELEKALEACRKQKATLVIAKLDRLGRNVHFISGLMESRVDFVAVDNPHANRLLLHLLAAFAEHEREMISKRTKEGLAAAKKRGTELGVHGRDVLSVENKAAANQWAKELAPIVETIRAEGYTTVRALTDELNRRGIPTPQDAAWHVTSVQRLLTRIKIMEPKELLSYQLNKPG